MTKPREALYGFLLVLVACGGVGADAATAPEGGSSPTEPGAVPPGAGAGGDAGAPSDAGPPPTCDVHDYGAKGDGITKDTAAIQAAIDACAGKNGIVHLRSGTFLSGMIVLKSAMTFRVDVTATLLGSQDDADYPTQSPKTDNTQLLNCRKALVYAEGVHDVTITGGGTIDGNGNTPKWIGPSQVHPEATRPMAIFTALSQHVTIESITMRNAAMWGIVSMEDDDLVLRYLDIDTPLSGNRDGIDIVDCHRVLVDSVTVRSEDDAICIKSGTRRGVEDVLVKDSLIKQSIVANGLKFGTASYGHFTNVTFQDIVVSDVDKAAMAVESVDGADIANIHFERIRVHGAGSPFFVLLGDRGSTPKDDVHKIGTIDGVTFEDITIDGMKYDWSSPISGLSNHRIRNLVFDGVALAAKGGLSSVPGDPPEYAGQYPDPNLWGNLPGYGYFFRHVDGVTFTKSTTTVSPADARPAIAQRDVTGFIGN